MRFLKPISPFSLVLATLTCALCVGAHPAQAQITVTLDTPNLTVVCPTSGSMTLAFLGTVTIAPGFDYDSAEVTSAQDQYGDLITPDFNDPGDIDLDGASEGHSMHGQIFTASIDPTTPLGVYNLDNFGTGTPLLDVTAVDALGDPVDGLSAFTITVLAPTANVPEPGAYACLAALGLTGVCLFRRLRQ